MRLRFCGFLSTGPLCWSFIRDWRMKPCYKVATVFALASVGWVIWLPLVSRAQTVIAAGRRPVAREPIEWIHLWLPNENKKDLPQVFLIGDSITEAYYQDVARI